MVKNILENIIKSSKNSILALTTLATIGTASAQKFGSGTMQFTTQDNQTTNINVTATRIGEADTFNYNANKLGDIIPFQDWPLTTLGVKDHNQAQAKVIQNIGAEFNAYITNPNNEKLKGMVFNLLGQKIANVNFADYGSITEAQVNLSHIPENTPYIVQIQGNSIRVAEKGITKNGISNGFEGAPSSISSFKSFNAKDNNAFMSEAQGEDAVNYNIVVTGDNVNDFSQDVEVVEGNGNLFAYTVVPSNGDVAWKPKLNGISQTNTTITVQDPNDVSKTYTVDTEVTGGTTAIFENVFVASPSTPTLYDITITSNDGIFLPTLFQQNISQDISGEVNGLTNVNVTPIPNEQDITMIVRNHMGTSTLQGITVELRNSNSDALIDTQISDVNGEVLFDNVPGETPVYTINYKSGGSTYKKRNGTYNVPLVDLISEQDTTLNVTTKNKLNYEDATQVTADTLNIYKPLAQHTEFALGHWRVYFPDIGGGNQVYKDHFADVATTLEKTGAILPSDTPFEDPNNNGTYNTYEPHITNRQVHDGLIGTNITNYSGTGTNRGEKTLSDEDKITFYTTSYNLGGLDWSKTDHEIGNALGFPLLNGNTTTFQTSRGTTASIGVAIEDSKHDKAIMPVWIQNATNHYNNFDYSLTQSYQE